MFKALFMKTRPPDTHSGKCLAPPGPLGLMKSPQHLGPPAAERPAGMPAFCPDGSSRCPCWGCVGNIFRRLAISGPASSTLPRCMWLMS